MGPSISVSRRSVWSLGQAEQARQAGTGDPTSPPGRGPTRLQGQDLVLLLPPDPASHSGTIHVRMATLGSPRGRERRTGSEGLVLQQSLHADTHLISYRLPSLRSPGQSPRYLPSLNNTQPLKSGDSTHQKLDFHLLCKNFIILPHRALIHRWQYLPGAERGCPLRTVFPSGVLTPNLPCHPELSQLVAFYFYALANDFLIPAKRQIHFLYPRP